MIGNGHRRTTIVSSQSSVNNYNTATLVVESPNFVAFGISFKVFTIPVAPGDVIIAATDGPFDNLYNNNIIAMVVHAVRAGLAPQVTIQKIVALARQRAQDKNMQTPFSSAAQDAGFHYYGGKLENLNVVGKVNQTAIVQEKKRMKTPEEGKTIGLYFSLSTFLICPMIFYLFCD